MATRRLRRPSSASGSARIRKSTRRFCLTGCARLHAASQRPHVSPQDRQEAERIEREKQLAEIKQKRELIKQEPITISFAYFDGSPHRTSIEMRKGSTIGDFLQACIAMLKKEFSELRGVSAERLVLSYSCFETPMLLAA